MTRCGRSNGSGHFSSPGGRAINTNAPAQTHARTTLPLYASTTLHNPPQHFTTPNNPAQYHSVIVVSQCIPRKCPVYPSVSPENVPCIPVYPQKMSRVSQCIPRKCPVYPSVSPNFFVRPVRAGYTLTESLCSTPRTAQEGGGGLGDVAEPPPPPTHRVRCPPWRRRRRRPVHRWAGHFSARPHLTYSPARTQTAHAGAQALPAPPPLYGCMLTSAKASTHWGFSILRT